jgi:muramoyltetrapeptide carboxypeptidase
MKANLLKRNDRVGIVAPGARPASPATVSYAMRVIEELGFTPVVGKYVLSFHGHMAGSDEERLSDLNGFIVDESIAAIFCITGGFGALPLLRGIEVESIEKSRKLIVGSDENTVLLLAVNGVCSLPVILAPNLDRVLSQSSFQSLKSVLTSAQPISIRAESEKLGSDLSISRAYSSFSGAATGTVIGGNLSAVLSLMGTPFEPDFEQSILYLDDYNERFDILDRWFTTLYVAGALKRTSGVVFGEFSQCGARGNETILPLEDLFGERLQELKKPNLFGLPIGHNETSSSMPLGVMASLDTTIGTIEFAEPALE